MSTDVDLRELAIDRGSDEAGAEGGLRKKRHVLTRYVLPLTLLVGFLLMVAWTARDIVLPPREVSVIPVYSTTAEVRSQGTPLFQAAGWIEPRPTPVRVAALAAGVVDQLLVVEDQPVAAGDPIAQLVSDDAQLAFDRARASLELYQAEVDQARVALAAAELRLEKPVHLDAQLNEAEASLATIETELNNLPFAIRRAEADAAAMQKDYQSKLASKGVVARIDIEIARSKADSATAFAEELRDRRQSLRRQRSALSNRHDAQRTQRQLLADEIEARDDAKAKIRAAVAIVSRAEVEVAEAKLRLDRMTVRAPVDGRVYQLIADPGTNLDAGRGKTDNSDGRTVITMYRPSMLQVRVDVRFEDIPQVSINQPVEINNPALSSPLTGKVLFISSEADIQKNTLEVKVEIPDPPPVFKPEMLVDATFLAPATTDPQHGEQFREVRIYVPQRLVQQQDENEFVWLADQSDAVARKVIIQTGKVGATGFVEVTSGLTVSSRLISNGSDGLQDGDRIQVIGEDSSLGTGTLMEPNQSDP